MANNRQMRFFYNGGWTRWFRDSEDLSFLVDNKDIEKMEVSEEMPRAEAEEYLKRFNYTN